MIKHMSFFVDWKKILNKQQNIFTEQKNVLSAAAENTLSFTPQDSKNEDPQSTPQDILAIYMLTF